MRTRLAAVIVLATLARAANAQVTTDPVPRSVDEFRSAVQAVLDVFPAEIRDVEEM